MKLAFDGTWSDEQMTVEFWQAEFASAHAEWLLHEMDRGRIEPPGVTMEGGSFDHFECPL